MLFYSFLLISQLFSLILNRSKQYRHEIKGFQTESEGLKRETRERFQQMEGQHADLYAV